MCLYKSIYHNISVHNIIRSFKFIWDIPKIEKERKVEKRKMLNVSEVLEIDKILEKSIFKDQEKNCHCSRWVWELWWYPHARGIINCEPIQGLLWQYCCLRGDQLWLLMDQSSESNYPLGLIFQEYQSDTITNRHQQRWRILRYNWIGNTEG